ncbi:MAG TPA: TIR domain-containing protein [Pyrinomonadaceae bacterium]|nr:TIR domain-containing protein [Pyrinomonadaceae bacterium]
MPHKYDIFISYGHLDDEDPAGDVKGWVDLLVERLPRLVSNNLGYLPAVWRDDRSLRGNDLLTAAISEGVTTSLLLIPIVSPRYVQSDWCRRELEAFCQSEPPAGAPAFRSRIFKVIKTPLLFHLAKKEPESLRELIGYSFYEMDGDMPVEFGAEVVPNKDPRYWTALRRLAWDVSNMLVTLKHAKDATTGPLVMPAPQANPSVTVTPPTAATNGDKKFVYLAETTSDLASERELVRDELKQRGYGVLPEEKLPSAELQQIQTVVNQALARSVLSVHLIGKRYGSTPEDNPRSLVCIQDDLAAQHTAKDPDFSRLLWMPQGLMTPPLEISDERQKEFVTALQNRIGERAELLQTSIEDLKTRIVEKLSPSAKQAAAKPARSKLKQVYLICENRDRSFIRPIKEFLFKQNIEVITWLDGETGRTLMDYHHKNLRECDAALVYFGNGDEPWVRKNLEDLEKAYGYGREQDWAASAVYVGAPPNDQKEDFLTHLVPYVIRNYQSFDPNDLRDFVTAVQTSEGEQG